MIRQTIYILAVLLMSTLGAYAQNETSLCEQSIGGISLNQSPDEMRAILSKKYPFKIKPPANIAMSDNLILATYKQGTFPKDKDSMIEYIKTQRVYSESRILLNHYVKVPKNNYQSWMTLDWEYGKYVQEKMKRLCTPETISQNAGRGRGSNVPALKNKSVNCTPGSSLEISEKSTDKKNPESQCEYSLSIGGRQDIQGGDGQHILLLIQEVLTYRL